MDNFLAFMICQHSSFRNKIPFGKAITATSGRGILPFLKSLKRKTLIQELLRLALGR